MKSPIYNSKGEKVSDITLPENVFAVPWNGDLVHQVVVGMQANARAGTASAHVKDRSEVRGGGKKPWRQKGTGRARHGSNRSPIWAGGGVTHGPRKEKDYSVTIPKKMRTKALFTVLSQKAKDQELLFVDSLSFDAPKTKEGKDTLIALGKIRGFEDLNDKKSNAALILSIDNDMNIKKSFSNFGNVAVEELRNLNPVDALTYKYLIVLEPKKALEVLEKRGT